MKQGNIEARWLGLSAGSSKQDVLKPYKEEEALTMLQIPAPAYHDTQSINYDQEVGQAV